MSATPGASRPIRLGIIGTGLAVEKLHWPALRQMPDRFQVVAFANHTRPKAEHFAAYSNASLDDYHAEYEQLLRRDDVEAVLIALPIDLNYRVTRAALAADKHVICEKPTGVDEAEGRDFLALAKEFPDRTVLIGENFFYRDDLRLARALLDDGVIGEVHLMLWPIVSQSIPRPGEFSSTPWRWHPAYRGGPQLDAGVHNTAQLRLLCGDVERVHGEMRQENSTMDGPSELTLNLRFASGAIGNLSMVYADTPVPSAANEMQIFGTRGVLRVRRNLVAIHRPDGTIEEHRFEGIDGGYYGELVNFHEAIIHNEPVVSTIAQSFQNLAIIMRGLDSAEQQQVVTLSDLPGGLSATSVPLWRPRGASGLFDGLPGRRVTETRQV